ncbi:Cytochrome b-c1 complex subunit [Lachnellula hyalina]|uniref:Cytochrome b-c1 complex subunit 7 n=1 Tax=Lachnellula hyalina TaxID=1316788 RepID=A0A8H8R2Y4_9HELO|nr:Cytochrome b-c1 complex subunit [Lachnellula hyalina]TVY26706.1 Cytochrome b-c1 complex subunit [Lachnellula hyalina]
MSAPSLANAIIKRPWLAKMVKPIAAWYADAAGYRKLGLRADDLIPEESENVLLALKRLPQKEAYDRVFRLRRAFQCSLAHQLLPKEQQTKPEEDYPYLSPIIQQVEAEAKERDDWDAAVVQRK